MTSEKNIRSSSQDRGVVFPYRKLSGWLNQDECSAIGALTLGATWVEGRQRTGYVNFDLLNVDAADWVVRRALDEIGNPTLHDAYLIRYPAGSRIPEHDDPAIEGMCHVRLNAMIMAGEGGLLRLAGEELPLVDGDAYIFRPDITKHSVSRVTAGPRLVLSVGANIEQGHAEELGLL